MTELTCFKAYDVRGEIGVNIDEGVAYRIGRAVAQHFAAKSIVSDPVPISDVFAIARARVKSKSRLFKSCRVYVLRSLPQVHHVKTSQSSMAGRWFSHPQGVQYRRSHVGQKRTDRNSVRARWC